MERNDRSLAQKRNSLAQKQSSLNPAPDTECSAAGACCRLAESRSRAASESSAAPVGVSQCAPSVANSRGWQDRMSHVSTLPSECATMLMLPCGSECVWFNYRNVNHVYVWQEMQNRMSHASIPSSECAIMLMVISSPESLCFEVCNASLQGGERLPQNAG